MRVGTTAVNFSSLIPADVTPAEAISRAQNFSIVGQVREVAEQGFDLIELSTDLTLLLPDAYSPAVVADLAALKDELGLAYTVHLPLWSLELSAPLTPVRDGSAQVVTDCIRTMEPLAPEMYVLHGTGPFASEFSHIQMPEMIHQLVLGQITGYSRRAIEQILKETGIESRRIAIETIGFPYRLTFGLAQKLDLSMCLDTGHVLIGFSGQVDLFEVLDECLPRLGEIHLHDAPWFGREGRIGYDRDHVALGMGDLDVGRLVDTLEAANWDGPVILEMKLFSHVLESVDFLRTLRPAAMPVAAA
jgi:sugar phosphate isomerase/epimerase